MREEMDASPTAEAVEALGHSWSPQRRTDAGIHGSREERLAELLSLRSISSGGGAGSTIEEERQRLRRSGRKRSDAKASEHVDIFLRLDEEAGGARNGGADLAVVPCATAPAVEEDG